MIIRFESLHKLGCNGNRAFLYYIETTYSYHYLYSVYMVDDAHYSSIDYEVFFVNVDTPFLECKF